MDRTEDLLRASGAMLEGHFLLSSGLHSDRYFQCARLFMQPERAALAMAGVAARLRAELEAGRLDFDLVVGPAMGGILPAFVLGSALGLPAIFTERDDSQRMCLRRGFEVMKGQKILIVEDVVTTGKSSGECARALEEAGGQVVALACVVDRRAPGAQGSEGVAAGTGPAEAAAGKGGDAQVAWPVFAAARLPATTWDAAACPLCARGLPFVKPGSRKLA